MKNGQGQSIGEKATSSVKSGQNGLTGSGYLGGMPGRKSVEAIEKVNTPGNAPGSVRA